jgi:hypothetical protein
MIFILTDVAIASLTTWLRIQFLQLLLKAKLHIQGYSMLLFEINLQKYSQQHFNLPSEF